MLDWWLKLDPWASLPWLVIAATAVVMVPFTRTFRSLSGVVTGCEVVDIRTVDDIPDEVIPPVLPTRDHPVI